MKTLRLNTPTTVDGRVRYPIEGTIVVSVDEAKRVRDEGFTDDEPEDWPLRQGVPTLAAFSVKELRAYAAEIGLRLGDITGKADIIAAIEHHQAQA